jgi:glycosyltransferase involved in cell wall biosynthesis
VIRSVSIVIPAHDEAPALRETLPCVLRGLPPGLAECEVLVVDDGSSDGTAALVADAAAADARVTALSHARNRGKGAALRTGFARARCEWVLLLDADHQVRVDELAPIVGWAGASDAVLGYRTGRREGLRRRVVTVLFRWVVRLALGVKVRDVNCPFKLLRREALQALPLTADGFMIDAEILHRLGGRGATFEEVAVAWHPRVQGESTLRSRHFPELVRELVRIARPRREPERAGRPVERS